jgi:hypothetical protein
MLKYFTSRLRSERGEAEWGIFILVMGAALLFTAVSCGASYMHDEKRDRKEKIRAARAARLAALNPVYRGPSGYMVLCKRSRTLTTLLGENCS